MTDKAIDAGLDQAAARGGFGERRQVAAQAGGAGPATAGAGQEQKRAAKSRGEALPLVAVSIRSLTSKKRAIIKSF